MLKRAGACGNRRQGKGLVSKVQKALIAVMAKVTAVFKKIAKRPVKRCLNQSDAILRS